MRPATFPSEAAERTAKDFLARLSGVQQTKGGKRPEWIADCPSCHRPSLSVAVGAGGLLVGCAPAARSEMGRYGIMYDSCDLAAVTGALGLTIADTVYGADRWTDAERAQLLRSAMTPTSARKPSPRRIWHTRTGLPE